MYLKRGDDVIIIAGDDKGKTGVVEKILPNNKVIVGGIAMVKKHQKAQGNMEGGIVEMERAIDASNVNLYDPKTKKPSRVKTEITKDKKIRKLVKTDKEV